MYVLVLLGGTWKDWGVIDMKREWKGLTRDTVWVENGTGRYEVLKPNHYIVAGLF